MSAQTIYPQQSRHNVSTRAKPAPTRSVAAIFSNHAQATWALDCLTKEGFSHLQVDIKPATIIDASKEIVVVRATHRAITALEILVNAGGDTKVNQADWIADNT